jgi:hypothetical protein
MWQTTPLKRNLARRFKESRIRSLGSKDENRYDRKELIEEIMESILYASKGLDSQDEMLIRER